MQTPTLAMLVDRESKIMNFKKEAYYMAHIMENGLEDVYKRQTLCDLIAGGKDGLQNDEKGIIDECIRHIYDKYF